MQDYILKNEYITNKEQVIEILEGKKISIKCVGVSKMYDYDSNNMYHYIITINKKRFDYYEGLGHEEINEKNENDKIINGLWCLLTDSKAYDNTNDLQDFMCEYGYNVEDLNKAQRIYNACKKIGNKLREVFTESELDVLMESIDL